MLITAISIISGKERTMDLPITKEQIAAWSIGGMMIQQAFPDLTVEQREFLMTGTTPDEWEDSLGELNANIKRHY